MGLQGEEADGHWAVGLLQHGVCALSLIHIWGTIPGRYMPQQIPFTGINRAELSQAALLVAGLNLSLIHI